MSKLIPAYRHALIDARDAFDVKYGCSIAADVADIRKQYGIDENSELARLLPIAMRKILLGLEHKVSLFSNWYDVYGVSTPNIPGDLVSAFPSYAPDVERIVKLAEPVGELDRFMKLEIGRNRVVQNLSSLIEENIGDVEPLPLPTRSDQVLGSIIKRSLLGYYHQNGRSLHMGVDARFKTALPSLKRVHQSYLVEAPRVTMAA